MTHEFGPSRRAGPTLLAATIPLALALGGLLLLHVSSLAAASEGSLVLTPASGTIAGTVFYSGTVTGTHMVWVGAFTTTQGGPPAFSVIREGPGPYAIEGIAPGVYYVIAGMDADDSGGNPDPNVDPLNMYAHNPVTVAAGERVDDVDIELRDPGGPPPVGGSISGEVTYAGRIPGDHNIIIFASPADGQGPPTHSTVITNAGSYTITNLPDDTYLLGAFMDLGGDMGPPEAGEPFGWHDTDHDGQPDLVTVSAGGAVSGVDIILLDTRRLVFLPALVAAP